MSDRPEVVNSEEVAVGRGGAGPNAAPSGRGRLGLLAAGVAHDLNNLLTILLGSLEQLHRQPLDERGRKQVERAEWAVRQSERLVDRVRSFGRRETPGSDVVDLNQRVEEFGRMFRQEPEAHFNIEVQLAPQPLPVRLNVGGFELALLNVVRNAIEATETAGHIVLATAGPGSNNQKTMVEVSVIDNGCGMPADAVSRATQALYTTKENGRGRGLGLWMVQEFLVGSDGELVIESQQGQGTTVRLRFPMIA